MKTIHEYEPSDIKMDGFADGEKMDPIHSFLMAQMFIIGLTGFKPQRGDPEDPVYPVKRHIANFLNAAQKAGITIAPAVPEAISGAFKKETTA